MKTSELTLTNREEISRFLVLGRNFTQIGSLVGRDKSCISREVNRDGMDRWSYRACRAHQHAIKQKKLQGRKKKLDQNSELCEAILIQLKKRYSPEQIVERLKIEYPDNKHMRISLQTIYSYLYVVPKKTLRRELLRCLRQQKIYRRKKGHPEEKRGKIKDLVSIEDRPKEVEDRVIPGHWEGDLIIGKWKQSAIGTLTERTTRTTIIVPLKNKNTETVRKAFAKEIKVLPERMRKSLTYDQGAEMNQHKLFTKDTKMMVYFAHKSSPWERGTNENTNGLIRQFFPKGTDFNKISVKELKTVQDLLNDRTRRCLGFKKPIEVFNELLQ